ncbi:MAG TPA: hypothetical protein VIL37_04050 [Natronosporangium sp.]
MTRTEAPPQLEVTVNAPPEQVWQALRDPDQLDALGRVGLLIPAI